MTTEHHLDLPLQDPAGTDPREFGDSALAQGHRVAQTPAGEVLILGNDEARAVATDADTFSSAVSAHLQIPNGLDGEEHHVFRSLIEKFLSPEALADMPARFNAVARDTVRLFAGHDEVDATAELGAYFSVHAMLQWLGWPREMAPRLLEWVANNASATRSGDRSRTAQVAADFDAIIADVVHPRIDEPTDDVTSRLINDTSIGRELSFDEIVSILRNWTGGDLSSMAYCIGVVLHGLAEYPQIQDRLRQDISEREYDAIIDEFLRLDSPFASNRRITACPVTLAGAELPQGQRVRILWTAANRDGGVVDKHDAFDPAANAEHNLVWGVGPHVCPGRCLSMMELRAIISAVLEKANVRPAGAGTREEYPTGGWARMPVRLEPR